MTDSLWTTLAGTVAAEFSDVPDLAEALRILLRLALALGLGLLLGYERESQGKSAGVRTHMLVALGSAIFMTIPLQIGVQPAELTRIIQGMVTGVGFLGAGTILKSDDESRVKGLTTAAGIWLTAAIGVAAGLGRESTAILGTLLAVVVLWVIPLVQRAAPTDPGQPAARRKRLRRKTRAGLTADTPQDGL